MEDRFPEEEYRRVCSALKPSFQAEQEVVNMAEPGKRPWRKKKAFVTLAAVLALTLSVSIVSVAATDGKIVEEVKDKVSLWFWNLTLDEEASTQVIWCFGRKTGRTLPLIRMNGIQNWCTTKTASHWDWRLAARRSTLRKNCWKTAYIRRNILMKARRMALRSREN